MNLIFLDQILTKFNIIFEFDLKSLQFHCERLKIISDHWSLIKI